MQPSEGRLKLEVEVANENAQHWKKSLDSAIQRGDDFRSQLRTAQALLQRCASFELNPDLQQSIDAALRRK